MGTGENDGDKTALRWTGELVFFGRYKTTTRLKCLLVGVWPVRMALATTEKLYRGLSKNNPDAIKLIAHFQSNRAANEKEDILKDDETLNWSGKRATMVG